MDKNELKDLVKSYFNLTEKNIENSENTEEVKLQSAKLVDGTPITNDKDTDFEVGDEVHVTTEAGEKVLAPSGEHALEDGIVLVIDGSGKITGLHKPGETGQGSLAEELPDSGPAKILNEEEKLSEVKEEAEETEVELNVSTSKKLRMLTFLVSLKSLYLIFLVKMAIVINKTESVTI